MVRFYLIGSNNTQTRFRVLKIDRMEPRALSVIDDKVEYTKEQIHDLVAMIDAGNRTRIGPRSTGRDKKANTEKEPEIVTATSSTKQSLWRSIWKRNTFPRHVPAFGLLGFVKFLEGYYIILVTKRRRVAYIGYHTIYKIEDTCMIYIPNDGIRMNHPDEQRYVKMFQSIDLSSNFYFSYSYDITHTLQNSRDGNSVQSADDFLPFWKLPQDPKKSFELSGPHKKIVDYGVRNNPNRRFVWNSNMLKDIEADLHPDWILYVTHGFVGQSNMSIYGRSIYVTIIARRSNKYAGTRFLKRGANFEGDVANEVETEQMVHDSGVSSLSSGHFSSFVQLRGSVPLQWSQSKMVPKPAISFDLSDPFYDTAGEHFNQLLKRYGSPVYVLNLVKKKERKKHESILSEEFSLGIKYLNQFLPPEHQIQYISFDMARKNKGKEAKVMGKLARIAHNAVCRTGIFQSQAPYFSQNEQAVLGRPFVTPQGVEGRLQTGIIRVNCVDCLDRTNTAQFALGKCALGFQLCALGVLETPTLEFDSDCVRMLEELYEDHGDTLALQYGDAEKQHTMNVFLGLFVPEENKPPIWELMTDYYLHHPQALGKKRLSSRVPQSQWWDTGVLPCLPRAYNEVFKTCSEIVQVSHEEEMVDGYLDYHRPYEFSILSEMFAYKISHSVSSSAESEDSDEEDNGHNTDSQLTPSKDSSSGYVTFESLFPSMRQVYGMEIQQPKNSDIHMYKSIAKNIKFIPQSAFSLDSSYQVQPPRVNRASQEIYRQYVERGKLGATEPSPTDLMKYQKYVSNTVLQRDTWDDLL
ncbi:hypothetical protein C0J52_03285 [Blattella germanica]|nr:hypothetical protein C0J52_03285 [Blattella germanica]